MVDDESEVEENEPYAKLIHRALMSAPGHRMVLKEIYDWFTRHTDKNKNPSQKGWQNSIRHNLSMNGVGPTSASKGNHLPPRQLASTDIFPPLIGVQEGRTGPAE